MGPRSFERGEARSAGDACGTSLLQWGHVHSNVESLGDIAREDLARAASMGPRSFERGEPVARLIEPLCDSRFNGATFIRTWRATAPFFTVHRLFWLQWGHVHSNVESVIGPIDEN